MIVGYFVTFLPNPPPPDNHVWSTGLTRCLTRLTTTLTREDNALQGGTICGAIEESIRSLKSIVSSVFINFRDKYAVFIHFCDKYAVFTIFCDKKAVITNFRDKNYVFEIHDKNTVFGFNFVCSR